jgi:hypothetical protein
VSVIMVSVIMVSVIMVSVIMVSVIMLSVVILNVVAPVNLFFLWVGLTICKNKTVFWGHTKRYK